MTFITKAAALSCAALLLSATAAFAQVGGGDIPASAKAKGGTTSSMMPKSSTKSGSMKSGSMMRSKGSMMRSKHNMMRSHGMMMRSGGRMSGHKTF